MFKICIKIKNLFHLKFCLLGFWLHCCVLRMSNNFKVFLSVQKNMKTINLKLKILPDCFHRTNRNKHVATYKLRILLTHVQHAYRYFPLPYKTHKLWYILKETEKNEAKI